MGIPLYETENANHSLETGDVDQDIKTMRKTRKTVRAYILGEENKEKTVPGGGND